MKKILVLALCVCLCGFTFSGLTACTPRSEKLIIYNWGEYMPEEVYKGFAKWYKEQTGEKVTVKYKEFETNEDMYTQIALKKADYDLVCPSDYMLERMQKEELLLKLDDETLDVVNANVNGDLVEMLASDTDGYVMPYLWGTLGILYNANSYTAEQMSSWSVLFEGGLGTPKKVWMKNSVRDSYSASMLYKMSKEGILNPGSPDYKDVLKNIFSIDGLTAGQVQDNLNTAETTLKAQKSNNYVKSYDVDAAKEYMLADKNGESGEFGLFWSCDAGYIMNGWEKDNNQNLRYIVPEEGSNVWIDGFAIPKYAKNTKAANWFIRYLCEGEVEVDGEMMSVPYLCMDYAGCTSSIEDAVVEYKADLEDDDTFWNNPEDLEFKQMFIDMMFPHHAEDDILSRCAVMSDFGIYNTKLTDMWERVRAS